MLFQVYRRGIKIGKGSAQGQPGEEIPFFVAGQLFVEAAHHFDQVPTDDRRLGKHGVLPAQLESQEPVFVEEPDAVTDRSRAYLPPFVQCAAMVAALIGGAAIVRQDV